ncbi:MAG: VTT domain-containing protein [Peptococcaceae bacterium]|nr:VTT domain-containing protein [Peptococcaceae bacterium]
MKKNSSLIAVILILIAAGLVSAFFYFDRQNAISAVILKLGWSGTILAVFLMALLCMTPVPSETLLMMYLKIYGVIWGAVLSWLGSIVSALIIFFIARQYGQDLMRKVITPERFEIVNGWVERKGTVGLFVARLLPLPAFAVNYIAGIIPSIRLWPYLWTAAISIIPYYVGTALLFMGITMKTWYWLLLGGIGVGAFWAASYLLNRKKFVLDHRR